MLSHVSETQLFDKYAPAIRSFEGDPKAQSLLIARSGKLSVFYAPFEWVNTDARVMVVGITPGRVQAVNALREAKRQIAMNATSEVVLEQAKRTGAFSGPLRRNLIAMLDYIGLDKWLGITGTSALFDDQATLLQSASVLQYPVFVDGLKDENYKGSPDIVATPFLRNMLVRYFSVVANSLPRVVMIPLGPVPSVAVTWLTETGCIQPRGVLYGLPHPSGANGERINYFLGRKPRSELSAKTNAAQIDTARASLLSAVAALNQGGECR